MQAVLTMRVVVGDNATKGTCKSNNENQHEILQFTNSRDASIIKPHKRPVDVVEIQGQGCMHA